MMKRHSINKAGVLPDKPSKLIRIALTDLERVEASDKYEVNMAAWHTGSDLDAAMAAAYDEYPVCEVCFAGAVMAMSLQQDIRNTLFPMMFDCKTESKLVALDAFRGGMVGFGLVALEFDHDTQKSICKTIGSHFEIHPYTSNPDRFKADMRKLSDRFAKAGY